MNFVLDIAKKSAVERLVLRNEKKDEKNWNARCPLARRKVTYHPHQGGQIDRTERGKGVEVISGESADRQWDEFVADAAAALPAIDRMHTTVPAFVEAPFDVGAQSRLRQFLESDELSRATAAAHCIVTRPLPLVEGA